MKFMISKFRGYDITYDGVYETGYYIQYPRTCICSNCGRPYITRLKAKPCFETGRDEPCVPDTCPYCCQTISSEIKLSEHEYTEDLDSYLPW